MMMLRVTSERSRVRREVEIPAGRGVVLPGILTLPERPSGLVIFAHGSGSGRQSARNTRVAAELRVGGLGTLLVDLLPGEEGLDRRRVFDIALLAERLLAVTRWAERELPGLPVAYFGASTGAAAALRAAGEAGPVLRAVVSRGGRPDLAEDALPRVRVPTLLLVGSRDEDVLELNRQAYRRMSCDRRLLVIPGAGHLFEEGSTLDQVAREAKHWFVTHLALAPSWQAR
jgi:putative phosphoribosyl transferase